MGATVTDPLLPIGDGHTPLSEDDRQGLIPTDIATRADLYAAEQRNIALGTLGLRPTADQLLDDHYLRNLHRRTLGDVWTWAGSQRRLEANLGTDPARIAIELRELTDNARTWAEHRIFSSDEIAARFHHRLVAIHAFPNGNGRHGRIAADLLVTALGNDRFTWGARSDLDPKQQRRAYRAALQRMDADPEDPANLLAFARS